MHITSIVGPPGCGKTHHLHNVVLPDVLIRHHPDNIRILSFSRNAIEELRKRARSGEHNDALSQIDPKDNILTVDALARRVLKSSLNPAPMMLDPRAEEDPKKRVKTLVDTWNERIGDELPEGWAIGGGRAGKRPRRKLKSTAMETERLRAMRVPLDEWHEDERAWFDAWEKHCTFYIRADDYAPSLVRDFSHIKEEIIDEGYKPDAPIHAIICDEAQDLSELDWQFLRQVCEPDAEIYLAGDPDQAVFRFRGSDPKYLSPEFADKWVALTDSHRCPQNVINLGLAALRHHGGWLSGVEYRAATGRKGRARLRKGKSSASGRRQGVKPGAKRGGRQGGLRAVDAMLQTKATLEAELGRPISVMMLGANTSDIGLIRLSLDKREVLYKSTESKIKPAWDLAGRWLDKRSSLGDFLNGCLGKEQPDWTWAQLQRWTSAFKKSGFRAGVLDEIKTAAKADWSGGPVGQADLKRLLGTTFLTAIRLVRDDHVRLLEEVGGALINDKAQRRVYAKFVRVVKKRGLSFITAKNSDFVTLGTPTSVKGGEADLVVMLHFLTARQKAGFLAKGEDVQPGQREQIVAEAYVGITRAKHCVIVYSDVLGVLEDQAHMWGDGPPLRAENE